MLRPNYGCDFDRLLPLARHYTHAHTHIYIRNAPFAPFAPFEMVCNLFNYCLSFRMWHDHGQMANVVSAGHQVQQCCMPICHMLHARHAPHIFASASILTASRPIDDINSKISAYLPPATMAAMHWALLMPLCSRRVGLHAAWGTFCCCLFFFLYFILFRLFLCHLLAVVWLIGLPATTENV